MWHDLKRAELTALRDRARRCFGRDSVAELLALLHRLESEPHAHEAICFHGAWALVHEADHRLPDAVRHRRLEIERIERLHAAMRDKPGAAFALRDYSESDLLERRAILDSLQQALDDGST